MSQPATRDKKTKSKLQPSLPPPPPQKQAQQQPPTLMQQLKKIIKSLNQFLKLHFDISSHDPTTYSNLVKQYFIEESTNTTYSYLISSFFSKISNMLQPFLSTTSQQDKSTGESSKLREEVSSMTYKIQTQARKIKNLKQQLNKYKEISTKLTNFVYMLRVNNIDVDTLYERGCREPERDLDPLSQQSYSNTEILIQPEIANYQTR